MKLFLATYSLYTSHYMQDSTTEDRQSIVWGDDREDAVARLEKHWDDKCSTYDVSYIAMDIHVEEAIV